MYTSQPGQAVHVFHLAFEDIIFSQIVNILEIIEIHLHVHMYLGTEIGLII